MILTLAYLELERQFKILASAPEGTVIIATFSTSIIPWYIDCKVLRAGTDYLIMEREGKSEVVELKTITSRIQHNYTPPKVAEVVSVELERFERAVA